MRYGYTGYNKALNRERVADSRSLHLIDSSSIPPGTHTAEVVSVVRRITSEDITLRAGRRTHTERLRRGHPSYGLLETGSEYRITIVEEGDADIRICPDGTYIIKQGTAIVHTPNPEEYIEWMCLTPLRLVLESITPVKNK